MGRPYHITFELADTDEPHGDQSLRVVPAAELHADTLAEQRGDPLSGKNGDGSTGSDSYDGFTEDQRTNRNIMDDPTVQAMTMAEIESLKAKSSGNAKYLVAKIAASHAAIEQKTSFSLAKYTSRKHRKYMKRFCLLPLDVPTLVDWMMTERDFTKVLELRNETLGLISCWANVHCAEEPCLELQPYGRYLAVDDTGGLIVAAMAEKMGILHPDQTGENVAMALPHHDEAVDAMTLPNLHQKQLAGKAVSAQSNTITMIHSNSQPNLALLKYFSFDTSQPPQQHHLLEHLKTLSWLQLLSPDCDPAYIEPESVSQETLASWKSSKRSSYHRKRRRWARTRAVVDSTRQGGFQGLVVASFTSPISILHHAVPLLAGGAQIVVYSPHLEPLVELADLYSTARRTAFINSGADGRTVPSKEFPLDPTLLLIPSIQTARLKRWQVLPGRTHPLMIGKGGAEGYVFVATRVLPAEGAVQARGTVAGKRRKVDRAPDSFHQEMSSPNGTVAEQVDAANLQI